MKWVSGCGWRRQEVPSEAGFLFLTHWDTAWHKMLSAGSTGQHPQIGQDLGCGF